MGGCGSGYGRLLRYIYLETERKENGWKEGGIKVKNFPTAVAAWVGFGCGRGTVGEFLRGVCVVRLLRLYYTHFIVVAFYLFHGERRGEERCSGLLRLVFPSFDMASARPTIRRYVQCHLYPSVLSGTVWRMSVCKGPAQS